MVITLGAYLTIVSALAVERLYELFLSARNTRHAFAIGAVEAGREQDFPLNVDAELNCHLFADVDVPRLTKPLFLAPDTIAGCTGITQWLRRTISLNHGRARRYSPEPAD